MYMYILSNALDVNVYFNTAIILFKFVDLAFIAMKVINQNSVNKDVH